MKRRRFDGKIDRTGALMPMGLCLLLLTCAGCNVTVGRHGEPGRTSIDGYEFTFRGETAEAQSEGTLPAALEFLEVDHRFGEVQIDATDDSPAWSWEIKCWGETPEDAEEWLTRIRLVADQLDGTATLRLEIPEAPAEGLRGIESKLVVSVPASTRLVLTNAHGATAVRNLDGDVAATCRHGMLELASLSGVVEAKTSFDSLIANGLQQATLANAHGQLRVEDVAGPLDARTSFADLRVTDVGDSVDLRNEHGTIVVSEIEGNVQAETSFAGLEVRSVRGTVDVRNQHGGIIVREAQGDVSATTSFETLDVRAPGAARILCRNEHGNIKIVASGEIRRVDARSSFGRIDVTVPPGLDARVDATTSFGAVRSEYPVGDLQDATTQVLVRNEHGDVTVGVAPAE